ncbi:hypothetical protein NIES2109_63460 (plasmid) [Nostoc sp. HK-01]|uniref:Uncharacterized protein n=1 Tax=Anabaenopsis circularis NIES-21 TaxID=1085406 RepID=A0A1Z4GC39_9CYAN|nr:hypothetical protein NIES21_08380 [Anabaenopsis circularis NIES-21]BBD63496.1 hypothetical protein NIES2109_63460 [Nostoc sp. HK-01]
MDDDTQSLIAIKEELERISSRLSKIFPQTHPQFDNVFEDLGAAGYYLREASYRLESALKTAQGDSAVSSDNLEFEETQPE